jgi:hypothetical protein
LKYLQAMEKQKQERSEAVPEGRAEGVTPRES